MCVGVLDSCLSEASISFVEEERHFLVILFGIAWWLESVSLATVLQ